MKLTNGDVIFSRKSGRIVHLGRDIIVYSIDIPKVEHEGFPNELFADVADNYIKYLGSLAERSLIPAYEKKRSEGARARDIKRELGIPINAFLNWKFSIFDEKYLSARCETRLAFSEAKKIFTLKAITFDLENMTVTRLSDISKRARRGKYFFFTRDKGLFIFSRGRVLADSRDSAEQKMGVRLCKIHNKRLLNLCKTTKIR